MSGLKNRVRVLFPLAGLLVFVLLAGTLPRFARGNDGAWIPVTVIYTSDVKGKIEPCG